MASSSLALFSLLFSYLLFSATLPLHESAAGGFSVDLIHRDSPESPYYNPSSTALDRARAAVHRSISRAQRIAASVSSTLAKGPTNGSNSFEADVIPNSFEYLMSLSLGTPPFKILAIADTGSDLTWTQCKPCDECYKQKDPLFDPAESSTYRKQSCMSESCAQLPAFSCGDNSACNYHYSYGDGSYSDGVLGVETFTFDSAKGKRRELVPEITFGCTHGSNGKFEPRGSGLVGLGGGPLSLVSQLGSTIGHKFSYCLVPYSDNSSSSALNFGDTAVVRGENVVTTPLISGSPDTFYFLQLDEMIVKNKPIPVTGVEQGNIIIDSGTTYTMLDHDVLTSLEDELVKIIDLPQTQDPDEFFRLCFKAKEGAEEKLPDVTLRFSGKADVVLKPLNTFVQASDEVVCLAFLSSNQRSGIPILGNLAQQNFHIGYDLDAKKLSFVPADCANL